MEEKAMNINNFIRHSHHREYYKRELIIRTIRIIDYHHKTISAVSRNDKSNLFIIFFIISYINSNMNIRNITIIYPKYNQWY